MASLNTKSFQKYARENAVSVTEISLEANELGVYDSADFESNRYESLKYKKVADRVKPVSATLPPRFRIERKTPRDPLVDMPTLPTNPPPFEPGVRYTEERREKMRDNMDKSITEQERRLIDWVIKNCEHAFAWDESEKGIFSEEYFPPVLIPTMDHDVWIFKNIPIPRGLYPKIIEIIKAKQDAGVIEPSNAAYRSQWFWVLKKDGKSLRIVHNLQPLNAVTIKDSAVPPIVEPYAETFAGRACYSVLDLFVGFDQRALAEESRDLTTFQTPLGTFRLTRIPMGYTNSQQVQHGDLCFLLQDEIPEVTMPFVDDVPIRGPPTRYEIEGGGYETIAANPGIRRYVWEHMQDVLRVIWRVGKAGGTFSGPKAFICVHEAVIVGHLCTYEGRRPVPDRVQKIRDWPTPKDLTDVRKFLGVVGTLRMFIKDYARHAEPLVKLTRKRSGFEFGVREMEAVEIIKQLVIACPAIRPIDYETEGEVILAVDSSVIGVGYVLSQVDVGDGKRYPSRFGSITWNEVERRYSQAKLELFGLFRALRDVRTYIIAVKALVVEVDARYIKGMINNPDIQPNATINRWIAGILLFDFTLRHVPAKDHTAADALSRRERMPNDPEDNEDYDEWIDHANGFAMQLLNGGTTLRNHEGIGTRDGNGTDTEGIWIRKGGLERATWRGNGVETFSAEAVDASGPRRTDEARKLDEKLTKIEEYLQSLKVPGGMDERAALRFIRYAAGFFLLEGTMFRRDHHGRHQMVIMDQSTRRKMVERTHNDLGHKGNYSVVERILTRYWWPDIRGDVRWFIQTCHECQIRSTRQFKVPPTISQPFALFRKFYIDTMFLPQAHGFIGLVHARCSLSAYPEWRMIRADNANSIAKFIYEDIICRYGMVEEIVTDNGTAYVAAMRYLEEKFDIKNVRISPYNSQANLVERRHFPVREALMKACNGNEKDWPLVAHSVIWAERVTIQKSTGYSPYFLAHGIEPVFPFDLPEAIVTSQDMNKALSTADLVAARARQLLRRPEDLLRVGEALKKARAASATEYEERFKNTIKERGFEKGELVLVRNSKFDATVGSKAKARYHGPMVVLRRMGTGSYVLAELDGSVSKLRYGAFRLVPYHPREVRRIPVDSITKLDDDELEAITMERESKEGW